MQATAASHYTLSDLQYRYRTGRSILLSGSGRNKVYSYRTGVATPVGDLEISEWKAYMMDAIRSSGELPLYEALRQWTKTNTYTHQSAEEATLAALEAHSLRLFDNPVWVDFIPFNRKFRPDVLTATELVQILPDCCQRPGEITAERLRQASSTGPFLERTVPFPICGRHATFQLSNL